MERRLPVGRVAGVHGLEGWLRVESWCEPREGIFRYRPWHLVLAGREWRVENVHGKPHGRGLLARLPGLEDVEAARRWVGATVEVPRGALPPLPEGEYYWADLEGLEVLTAAGLPLGRVRSVFPTGANEVLVVRGERERLIPFVRGRYVLEVDLKRGRLVVDWDPDF